MSGSVEPSLALECLSPFDLPVLKTIIVSRQGSQASTAQAFQELLTRLATDPSVKPTSQELISLIRAISPPLPFESSCLQLFQTLTNRSPSDLLKTMHQVLSTHDLHCRFSTNPHALLCPTLLASDPTRRYLLSRFIRGWAIHSGFQAFATEALFDHQEQAKNLHWVSSPETGKGVQLHLQLVPVDHREGGGGGAGGHRQLPRRFLPHGLLLVPVGVEAGEEAHR